MISLTPMEIRHHTFKKRFKGFDVDEVNHFVETAAGCLESALLEKEGLTSEVRELRVRLEKYEKLEQTLQEMLLQSQKTVEETKSNAERQAAIVIKEAEIKAQEIKKETEHELEEMKKSIVILKEQKKMYLLKFRTLVKSQADMLNLLEAYDPNVGRKGQMNLMTGENLETGESELKSSVEA